MNIFFDVDYTLISFEGRLRPNVKEVFQQLLDDEHKIYIWSGVGLRHEIIKKFELEPFVSGVYWKPIEHYEEKLIELGVDIRPDFIIDDDFGIVEALGGYLIKAYSLPNPDDKELWKAYEAIQEHSQV